MLIAYLDESGTHGASEAVAVGGLIGRQDDWLLFDSSWRSFLSKYGIPAFHMATFENRLPPFDGWYDIRRLRCLRQAHRSLTFYASTAIASAVVVDDYAKIVSTPALRAEVGTPYCAAIKKCFTLAANWSAAHADARPISFVFEDGATGKGEVQAMLEQIRQDPKWGPLLGTVEFRGKECLPLQAADIVAYEVWKQMVNQHVAGERRDVRKSLYNIMSGLPFEDAYFNEENLRELVDSIEAKQRRRDTRARGEVM